MQKQIKKIVETFIDENYFTILIWYHIILNKYESKAFYPKMMSLLELCVIILSSKAEVESVFSVIKLFCAYLRARMLLSILSILMQNCLCRNSLANDAFETIVGIYQDSVVDENHNGSQTKRQNIFSEKD